MSSEFLDNEGETAIYGRSIQMNTQDALGACTNTKSNDNAAEEKKTDYPALKAEDYTDASNSCPHVISVHTPLRLEQNRVIPAYSTIQGLQSLGSLLQLVQTGNQGITDAGKVLRVKNYQNIFEENSKLKRKLEAFRLEASRPLKQPGTYRSTEVKQYPYNHLPNKMESWNPRGHKPLTTYTMRKEIESIRLEKEQCNSQLEISLRHIRDLELNLWSTQLIVQELKVSKQELEGLLNSANARRFSIADEAQIEINKKVEEVQEAYQKKAAEYNGTVERLRQSCAENEKLKSALLELEENLANQKRAISRASVCMQESSQNFNDLHKDLEEKKAMIETLQESKKKEAAKLKEQIEEQSRKLIEIEKSLKQEKNNAQALKKDIKDFEKEREKQQVEQQNLKEQKLSLENQAEKLKKEISAAKEEAEKNKKEIQNIKEKLEKEEKSQKAANEKLTALEGEKKSSDEQGKNEKTKEDTTSQRRSFLDIGTPSQLAKTSEAEETDESYGPSGSEQRRRVQLKATASPLELTSKPLAAPKQPKSFMKYLNIPDRGVKAVKKVAAPKSVTDMTALIDQQTEKRESINEAINPKSHEESSQSLTQDSKPFKHSKLTEEELKDLIEKMKKLEADAIAATEGAPTSAASTFSYVAKLEEEIYFLRERESIEVTSSKQKSHDSLKESEESESSQSQAKNEASEMKEKNLEVEISRAVDAVTSLKFKEIEEMREKMEKALNEKEATMNTLKELQEKYSRSSRSVHNETEVTALKIELEHAQNHIKKMKSELLMKGKGTPLISVAGKASGDALKSTEDDGREKGEASSNEINKLKLEKEKMEQEIEEVKKTAKETADQLKDSENKLKTKEEDVKAIENENKTLQEAASRHSEETSQLKAAAAKLEEELSQLASSSKRKDNEKDAELIELKKAQNQEINELKGIIDNQTGELKKLRELSESASSTAVQNLAEAQETQEKKNQEILNLKELTNTQSEELNTLRETTQIQNEELARLRGLTSTQSEELNTLRETTQIQNEELASLRGLTSTQSEELNTLRELVNSQKEEIKYAEECAKSQEDNIISLKESFREQSKSISDSTELQQEVKAARESVFKAEQELTATADQLNAMEARKRAALLDLQEMTQKSEELQTRLNTSQILVSEQAKKLEEADNEIKALREMQGSKVNSHLTDRGAWGKDMEAQDALREAKEDIRQYKEQIDKMQKDNVRLSEEKSNLQQALQEKEREMESFQRKSSIGESVDLQKNDTPSREDSGNSLKSSSEDSDQRQQGDISATSIFESYRAAANLNDHEKKKATAKGKPSVKTKQRPMNPAGIASPNTTPSAEHKLDHKDLKGGFEGLPASSQLNEDTNTDKNSLQDASSNSKQNSPDRGNSIEATGTDSNGIDLSNSKNINKVGRKKSDASSVVEPTTLHGGAKGEGSDVNYNQREGSELGYIDSNSVAGSEDTKRTDSNDSQNSPKEEGSADANEILNEDQAKEGGGILSYFDFIPNFAARDLVKFRLDSQQVEEELGESEQPISEISNDEGDSEKNKAFGATVDADSVRDDQSEASASQDVGSRVLNFFTGNNPT